MPRVSVLCLIGLLYSSFLPVAAQDKATQEPAQDKASELKAAQEGSHQGDPQMGKLVKEIQDLKQLVADQNRKIGELERSIKTIQAFLMPAPKAIPSETPAWMMPSSWNLIRAGMSEAQVVQVLGPPARVQSVTDSRILLYQPDLHSTSNLRGSVTLMDDRVIAMSPPAF